MLGKVPARLVLPRALGQGDCIGVLAPSGPHAALFPRRFERGISNLQALGFDVLTAPHARSIDGYVAGSAEQRADDLHKLFADPSVHAVMTTIGGYNANAVLDLLDFDLIAANPKPLVGYSDITVLLLAITARTGLVTFQGPQLLPQIAEAGGCDPYVVESLRRVVMTPAPAGILSAPARIATEMLFWDSDDDRPRARSVVTPPIVAREGDAEGTIVAAHLGSLQVLLGTPWFPDLDGVILCLEESDNISLATLDRGITHLRQAGAFDRIAALVVGRMPISADVLTADAAECFAAAVRDDAVPILMDMPFGHVDPACVLPNGVHARVDARQGVAPTFEILGAAVQRDC